MPPSHGLLTVDKESPKEISLTLHLDENADSFNKSETVKGKKAIDLMNNFQKEGTDQI